MSAGAWFSIDWHEQAEPAGAPGGALTGDHVNEVLALASAAGDTDGTYPLAEQVLLQLRHGGDASVVHLLARDGDRRLVGYAHLDTADPAEGALAELVVHPDARRHGLGRALVERAVTVVTERDPAGRLRLWAHGDHPAAAALARSLGLARARVLYQLRRSIAGPIAPPRLPDGVVLRSFRLGVDEAAWLAVNARAFADHPEQGRWTVADLRQRIDEPWFDPDGFLLAVRIEDDRLLGFHWTKIHKSEAIHKGDADHPSDADHGDGDPLGEVYVLGVDPDAHGTGLGTALTVAGLRYLQGRGLTQAMLYADESNTAAVALYTKLGFTRWAVDVAYARNALRDR